MDSQQNPFQSPQADISDSEFTLRGQGGERDQELERIRRKYLNHEASVRSVGLLYYLAAALMVIAAITPLAMPFGIFYLQIFIAVFCFVFCLAFGVVGYGLQKLERWVRIPVTIFGVLGIVGGIRGLVNPGAGGPIGPVIGLLLNIYVLAIVWSEKGTYVLSDEYRAVIAATPYIKYKTSLLIKILAGLLLFFILLGLLVFLFSGQQLHH
jgi:hypothetical protein